jgi:hypothetical protein
MPPEQAEEVVFASLTDEPTTTSDLYERVGYMELMRVGLIPYHAFRSTLARLAAAGRAVPGTDEDGATVWRRAGG